MGVISGTLAYSITKIGLYAAGTIVVVSSTPTIPVTGSVVAGGALATGAVTGFVPAVTAGSVAIESTATAVGLFFGSLPFLP